MYVRVYALIFVVPEPVYLLENLRRVYMSRNAIKELSSLIDTWQQVVTLDLSFNQITALHVRCSLARMHATIPLEC